MATDYNPNIYILNKFPKCLKFFQFNSSCLFTLPFTHSFTQQTFIWCLECYKNHSKSRKHKKKNQTRLSDFEELQLSETTDTICLMFMLSKTNEIVYNHFETIRWCFGGLWRAPMLYVPPQKEFNERHRNRKEVTY